MGKFPKSDKNSFRLLADSFIPFLPRVLLKTSLTLFINYNASNFPTNFHKITQKTPSLPSTMASSSAAVAPPASPGNATSTAAPEPFLESRVVPFCCRTLALGTIVFTLTYFFAIILWVPLHPNSPKINVTSATLSAAECNVTFVIGNTNRHLAALFDRIEVSLLYPSKQLVLSRTLLPPIVQPKRSRSSIESNLILDGVNLGIDVKRGSITLGVKVYARVRYRHGKWETKGQEMWGYCRGVSLNPYRECEVYDYHKSV